MLNWIALWIGGYLFGLGGPLQNDRSPSCRSRTTSSTARKLQVFWGDPQLQGLHIGLFIALAAAIVYWVLSNRTALGYEVRAVGFNPEAARYGGISVGRNYFLAMAICGLVRRPGRRDGHARLAVPPRHERHPGVAIGFIGIAVALLGRNTAVGVVLAALLFGALLQGTSTRNLDPTVFEPELAGT